MNNILRNVIKVICWCKSNIFLNQISFFMKKVVNISPHYYQLIDHSSSTYKWYNIVDTIIILYFMFSPV